MKCLHYKIILGVLILLCFFCASCTYVAEFEFEIHNQTNQNIRLIFHGKESSYLYIESNTSHEFEADLTDGFMGYGFDYEITIIDLQDNPVLEYSDSIYNGENDNYVILYITNNENDEIEIISQ